MALVCMICHIATFVVVGLSLNICCMPSTGFSICWYSNSNVGTWISNSSIAQTLLFRPSIVFTVHCWYPEKKYVVEIFSSVAKLNLLRVDSCSGIFKPFSMPPFS